jgi:hypothetical protein
MTSALDITRAVNPPRAVFLNFPLGHQTGKPHQFDLQRQIVRDSMRAFETISKSGGIVELPYIWDPNDRRWEETDYTKGFLPSRPERNEADKIEDMRRAKFTESKAK